MQAYMNLHLTNNGLNFRLGLSYISIDVYKAAVSHRVKL